MQAQNPSSSAVEASTPPNIKRYLVKETWKEYEVTVEVNHDVLTEEIASMTSWLASDESGFSTGADFSLNGGLHMG